MNTTACLFICLWIDIVVSRLIPPRKLHSSGNLAMGTVSLTSLAISLLFLVFPFTGISFWVYPLSSRLWCWVESWPWAFGRGWLGLQPFPPCRAAVGAPSSADPNLPAGVWRGEASATPRSWRVCSSLGPAVPLAVLTNHCFAVSRQHQPQCFACLLWSNAEKKRTPWFICLSCALFRCRDTKPDLIYMELTALVPLNYKRTQLSIKWLNRYL